MREGLVLPPEERLFAASCSRRRASSASERQERGEVVSGMVGSPEPEVHGVGCAAERMEGDLPVTAPSF